jgi:site-specific DNA-methyltransferase (adenine-specific)
MKPYYEHAGITIYHGDCREVLPPIDFDCVVMDPPYGINHTSNYGASWENTEIQGDGDTSLRDWVLSTIIPQRLPIFVFGTWKVPRPERTRQVLIWDKGPAFGMGDLSFPWKNSFEEIYVIGDGFYGSRDEAVLRGHLIVSWESKGRVHPNQKPESLIKYLIGKTGSKEICDPFMGSGTTLRAAKDLGRKAIGIEIEEKYCEIAAKRLGQEVLPL